MTKLIDMNKTDEHHKANDVDKIDKINRFDKSNRMDKVDRIHRNRLKLTEFDRSIKSTNLGGVHVRKKFTL